MIKAQKYQESKLECYLSLNREYKLAEHENGNRPEKKRLDHVQTE